MKTNLFYAAFTGVMGGMAGIAAIGIVCIILFGLGYYLVNKYNKPGTKLFKDMVWQQYLGALLMLIACAPFIQYFFFGFLSSAGSEVFENMFGE